MEQSKDSSTAKRTLSTNSLSSPDDLVIDNSESMELTSSSKWHLCIDCGKEFSSQAKLSAHMKAHLGNFHCTVEVSVRVAELCLYLHNQWQQKYLPMAYCINFREIAIYEYISLN